MREYVVRKRQWVPGKTRQQKIKGKGSKEEMKRKLNKE